MELAAQARAATGEEKVRLKERLRDVMEEADLHEHKAAGVRRRWTVMVTDLTIVRPWAKDEGFVESEEHADEDRLRRNLGEWIAGRLHNGTGVPPDGFEVLGLIQLSPLPSAPRLR